MVTEHLKEQSISDVQNMLIITNTGVAFLMVCVTGSPLLSWSKLHLNFTREDTVRGTKLPLSLSASAG